MNSLLYNCTFGLKISVSPRNAFAQANVYTSCLLPSDELTKFKNVRHSCEETDIFRNLSTRERERERERESERASESECECVRACVCVCVCESF
jgi:hypothetical protein